MTMNGWDSREWNLKTSEEKHALRIAYAEQFGKSWVETVLYLKRGRTGVRVFIRLKSSKTRDRGSF
jgi:hypothetical protein